LQKAGVCFYSDQRPPQQKNTYVLAQLLLHLFWHKLVKKEEIIMINTFGDIYTDYARRTGRFFPKMMNYGVND